MIRPRFLPYALWGLGAATVALFTWVFWWLVEAPWAFQFFLFGVFVEVERRTLVAISLLLTLEVVGTVRIFPLGDTEGVIRAVLAAASAAVLSTIAVTLTLMASVNWAFSQANSGSWLGQLMVILLLPTGPLIYLGGRWLIWRFVAPS